MDIGLYCTDYYARYFRSYLAVQTKGIPKHLHPLIVSMYLIAFV